MTWTWRHPTNVRSRAWRSTVVALVVAATTFSPALSGVAHGGAEEGTAPVGDESEKQLDDSLDVGPVVARARAALGDRFGMAWIDTTDEPVLKIGVTGDGAIEGALLAALPPLAATSVMLTPVRVSQATLGGLKEQVLTVLEGTTASYAVGIDAATQRLVIRLDHAEPPVQAAIQAIVPADVLDLAIDAGLGFDTTHGAANQYPPYEGGLRVTFPTGSCTSGFTITRGGQSHGTTAGHCARVGDRARIGGEVVGAVTVDTGPTRRGSGSDALAYRVADSARTARIFLGPGRHRRVTDMYANAALVQGTRVCFRGAATGAVRCDEIRYVDWTFSDRDEHTRVNHAWCVASVRSIAGDSGSPVYHPFNRTRDASAAGLLIGHLNIRGQHPMCFSSIENVIRDLGGQLVLA